MKAKEVINAKLGTVKAVKMYIMNEECTDMEEITNQHEFGHFFDEEVYVIQIQGSQHEYMINWQGRKIDGALQAKCTEAMTAKLCGGEITSDQTKDYVRQCQEPESLISFFPNGFYILNGKRVPMDECIAKIKQGSLFAVIAPYGGGARIIQQSEVSSARLNPHHVYTATFGDKGYLWMGSKSCDIEKNCGKMVIEHYTCPDKYECEEGKEDDFFWEVLGGKADYAQVKDLMMQDVGFDPLLFEVSNKTGYMTMTQLPCLSQQALFPNDVYIVDNFNKIFIWHGATCNKFERNGAVKRVDQYIDALTDGRNHDSIQVATIEQGQEPPMFTLAFENWDNQYFKSHTVESMKKEIAESQKEGAP